MQCDILHFSWFTMKYGFIDQRSPYQIIKLNLSIELPPLVVDRKIYTFYQISFLSWIQKNIISFQNFLWQIFTNILFYPYKNCLNFEKFQNGKGD